jgi:hypothetical protein
MRTVIHLVCRRCGGGAWQAIEGDTVEELVQVAYEAATVNLLDGLLCKCSPGWGCDCIDCDSREKPDPIVEWVEEHFD